MIGRGGICQHVVHYFKQYTLLLFIHSSLCGLLCDLLNLFTHNIYLVLQPSVQSVYPVVFGNYLDCVYYFR